MNNVEEFPIEQPAEYPQPQMPSEVPISTPTENPQFIRY